MDEAELRALVELPRLHTIRDDGIDELEIARLVDEAARTLDGPFPATAQRLRRDLYSTIVRPAAGGWNKMYATPIKREYDGRSEILWSLVLTYTSYSVTIHRDGDEWPCIPSSAQIAMALTIFLRPHSQDPRELF